MAIVGEIRHYHRSRCVLEYTLCRRNAANFTEILFDLAPDNGLLKRLFSLMHSSLSYRTVHQVVNRTVEWERKLYHNGFFTRDMIISSQATPLSDLAATKEHGGNYQPRGTDVVPDLSVIWLHFAAELLTRFSYECSEKGNQTYLIFKSHVLIDGTTFLFCCCCWNTVNSEFRSGLHKPFSLEGPKLKLQSNTYCAFFYALSRCINCTIW